MLAQQATQAAPSAAQVAPSAPPPVPVAPGPVPWMRGLAQINRVPVASIVPDAVAQTNAHFFSDPQMVTLRRLCQILMPPFQGYPGAVEAETPEFLDFLIGASPADRQQTYQSGLDRLNHEAQQRFGLAFVDVTPEQADQLIRPWLRTWMSDHPPTDPYAHFMNTAHSDIRTATINSQAWADAAKAAGERTPDMGIYWFPVEPDIYRDRAMAAAPKRTVQKKRHS